MQALHNENQLESLIQAVILPCQQYTETSNRPVEDFMDINVNHYAELSKWYQVLFVIMPITIYVNNFPDIEANNFFLVSSGKMKMEGMVSFSFLFLFLKRQFQISYIRLGQAWQLLESRINLLLTSQLRQRLNECSQG